MWQRLSYSFLLMFVSPVMGLIQAMYGTSADLKRYVLIIFITFYGSLILFPEGSDGAVHQNAVYNYYSEVSFPQFLADCRDILTFKENHDVQEDLFIHVISYFTGGIMGVPGLFFVIVAFVFGYFYSGAIFMLVKILPQFKYSWMFYGFLAVFVMWKGVESMNTVRTWTGLWVLVYGCIGYYQTKKLKFLIFMFIPQHFHVGYYIMALPAWIVFFVGVRPKVFSILFFLSFVTNILNPTAVQQQLETVEVGEEQVRDYSVEEQVDAVAQYNTQSEKGSTLYRSIVKSGIQYYVVSFMAVFLILRGYYSNKMNYLELHLFSIGILTRVLSSATWFHYALSNRSSFVAGIFILAAFISLAQRGGLLDKDGKFPLLERIFFFIALLFLVPTIVYKLSEYTYFISVFLFSTPFIGWIAPEMNISLKDLLNLIFR